MLGILLVRLMAHRQAPMAGHRLLNPAIYHAKKNLLAHVSYPRASGGFPAAMDLEPDPDPALADLLLVARLSQRLV